MTASHNGHAVLQSEPLQRPVGFAVLQHHFKVALPMLRLLVRQTRLHQLAVPFPVLHFHVLAEALRRRVTVKMDAVVVHARHGEVPAHLLVVGEIVGIVGGNEGRVGDATREVDFHNGHH